MLHDPPQMPGSGDFLPRFLPDRHRRGVEMPYLLVTAASWTGRPEPVTSLPSWSCGFDSRRPLYASGTAQGKTPISGCSRAGLREPASLMAAMMAARMVAGLARPRPVRLVAVSSITRRPGARDAHAARRALTQSGGSPVPTAPRPWGPPGSRTARFLAGE